MARLDRTSLFAYGLFGMPLAMVALPVYVYVPQLYAERFGLSLTLIGTALLLARLFDAFLDPALGLWIDGARRADSYRHFVLLSLPMLAVGFVALFHPPALATGLPLTWFMVALLVVYVGFSLATISHQSWGAALTQAPTERSRLTATREGCGLIGVIIAAALPALGPSWWLTATFLAVLAGSVLLLARSAPLPPRILRSHGGWSELLIPFRSKLFRWLFAVFVVNGIAAAIPATLFLFFASDRLRLGQQAGLFLVLYFVAAAASMPLWVALAKRLGEARAWMLSMLLAVAGFIWAYALGAGDATAFGVICVLSGLTLGADLALPPALLAAVIHQAGDSGKREGVYFGSWSWATKMNLALAAGISLPLLEWLGYVPGLQSESGGQALSIAYAVVPCLLKLLAAVLLWRAPLRTI
ncbi:MAG: GPH family glycoside/pentoside/hexuronide:cation symporter [Bradyrhizobium sp.]|jgi:GPH family glycoside/pentoside/hexuronide:cation symporter